MPKKPRRAAIYERVNLSLPPRRQVFSFKSEKRRCPPQRRATRDTNDWVFKRSGWVLPAWVGELCQSVAGFVPPCLTATRLGIDGWSDVRGTCVLTSTVRTTHIQHHRRRGKCAKNWHFFLKMEIISRRRTRNSVNTKGRLLVPEILSHHVSNCQTYANWYLVPVRVDENRDESFY